LLNWLLIYGKFGFPTLGLAGAGWATLISRVVIVAVLWVCLARAKGLRAAWPSLRAKTHDVARARWSAPLSRTKFSEMLHLGVPAAGHLFFEGGAFTAAAIIMGWLGTVALAAHQIALSCAAATFMFMLGLSMAVSIRIGQATGAGEQARRRPIGFGALGLCVAGMTLAAILFFSASRPIAALFINDPEVVALAAKLLIVAGVFQIFDGVQVVGAGALRGLTDVKIPTAITFVAYWLIALPSAYWFGVKAGHGPIGVWIALAAGLACAAVLLTLRFARLTR
jgi:MATE family multidrug resistance protein